MRKTLYEELYLKALDLFHQKLEQEPAMVDLIKAGTDGSKRIADIFFTQYPHVVESITEEVLPDDVSDEKIVSLLREKPSFISMECFGPYMTMRELALDLIRYDIECGIFGEEELWHSPAAGDDTPNRGI